MADLYLYDVDTLNAWRLVGHTRVEATSAEAAGRAVLAKGYTAVDVYPAAEGRNPGLKVRHGDTFSTWPTRR